MPTIWAQKERNGLLAQESPELREKRLQAEDPNATASVLSHLANEVDQAVGEDTDPKDPRRPACRGDCFAPQHAA